jgi:hypothetical protein
MAAMNAIITMIVPAIFTSVRKDRAYSSQPSLVSLMVGPPSNMICIGGGSGLLQIQRRLSHLGIICSLSLD